VRVNSERVESRMSDVWYYADARGHIGPFSLKQLKATLSTVANPGETWVWCPAFPNWKRADDVPELCDDPVPPPRTSASQSKVDPNRGSPPRGPKWWWFVWLFSLFSSSRAGREEMSRLSSDRLIVKETKRWLNEGPPDIAYVIVALVREKFLFVLVSLACVFYGMYNGVVTNNLSSGLIAGILSAGILNLAILTVRKYRLKKPNAIHIRIGMVAYWIGWALAFYGIFVMVYGISHVGVRDGLSTAVSLFPSVIFYPAVGWSIRYMLGGRRRNTETTARPK
jgi:hypothetical protein